MISFNDVHRKNLGKTWFPSGFLTSAAFNKVLTPFKSLFRTKKKIHFWVANFISFFQPLLLAFLPRNAKALAFLFFLSLSVVEPALLILSRWKSFSLMPWHDPLLGKEL